MKRSKYTGTSMQYVHNPVSDWRRRRNHKSCVLEVQHPDWAYQQILIEANRLMRMESGPKPHRKRIPKDSKHHPARRINRDARDGTKLNRITISGDVKPPEVLLTATEGPRLKCRPVAHAQSCSDSIRASNDPGGSYDRGVSRA